MPEKHMECRLRLVKYMEAHPDDFSPFMEDDEKWDDYVPRMKTEREWGGQLEIVAASRLFQVRCCVVWCLGLTMDWVQAIAIGVGGDGRCPI